MEIKEISVESGISVEVSESTWYKFRAGIVANVGPEEDVEKAEEECWRLANQQLLSQVSNVLGK